jgi:F-type H+-transporting ATPase subunit delta
VKDSIVAARYARALFIVTEKRGDTVRALEDLKGLVVVMAHGTPVALHLASPQLRLADKREALRRALEPRVARVVLLFVDLLLRKRRLDHLDSIAAEFEALVEDAQGIQRALAVSAVPMEEAEVARLHAALERTTGKKIKLTREVDPSILGGALVRIGDHVIDRTVRTLLESIEKQLYEVPV